MVACVSLAQAVLGVIAADARYPLRFSPAESYTWPGLRGAWVDFSNWVGSNRSNRPVQVAPSAHLDLRPPTEVDFLAEMSHGVAG